MPKATRARAAVHGLTVAAAALGLSLPVACHKADSTAGGSSEDGGSAAATGSPAASLAFLKGFEGEIDGFVKDNKPGEAQVPLAVMIKGDKVRFDVPEKLNQKMGAGGPTMGQKAYVIFDGDTKKLDIVMDAQKQVIIVDLNKTGEDMKGMGGKPEHGGGPPGTPEGPPTKLTKTGKTDTVAGYKCEYWDISSDHREGTVCVAQEGFSWFSIPMTGIPTERAWMAELLDGKHFPLRFIGYAKDGATEETRVEVTKIDKKSIPDTQFQYPPTYTTLDLAQMLKGLGSFRGMPGMPMPGMSGLPMHGPPHGLPTH